MTAPGFGRKRFTARYSASRLGRVIERLNAFNALCRERGGREGHRYPVVAVAVNIGAPEHFRAPDAQAVGKLLDLHAHCL